MTRDLKHPGHSIVWAPIYKWVFLAVYSENGLSSLQGSKKWLYSVTDLVWLQWMTHFNFLFRKKKAMLSISFLRDSWPEFSNLGRSHLDTFRQHQHRRRLSDGLSTSHKPDLLSYLMYPCLKRNVHLGKHISPSMQWQYLQISPPLAWLWCNNKTSKYYMKT